MATPALPGISAYRPEGKYGVRADMPGNAAAATF